MCTKVTMSSPAPKSPDQTDKSKKYDRQLRLWGDHGQNALEGAKVCLINATAAGTEILKSLVLPGIGAFTIVDGNQVAEEDIGSNFFLDPECIGKSRAAEATRLLLELNQDVRGDYVDETVEHLLLGDPDFFSSFSVVIGVSLSEKELLPLSRKLWDTGVPLVVCRSYGFVGYIRIQLVEHTVVESHPDNQNPDLRLDRPFPALRELADAVNLDELDLKEHAHLPYAIVLLKYLDKWRAAHDGRMPASRKDKDELRDMIRAGIRVDENGVPVSEENFEEAIRAANSIVVASKIPSGVKEILDDGRCVNVKVESKQFWVMAKAVRDFVENEGEGLLPLRGSVPDMTAKTDRYVALQQVYHEQAVRDAEIVYRYAQVLLRQLNQSSDVITETEVRQFCKHASELHVVRGSSVAEEYEARVNNSTSIAVELENPESMIVYYVMLRGVDRFRAEYNAYPGEFDDQVEPDIVKLKACISKLLNEWGCGPLAKDDYVHEICRFGGAEIHSVSSFIGGCAAQEVIKLITRQYKPVNNTFIHDAISSSTATYVF